MDNPTLGRRAFLGSGAGLTLALVLPATTRLEAATGAAPAQVNAWLAIGSDDSIPSPSAAPTWARARSRAWPRCCAKT